MKKRFPFSINFRALGVYSFCCFLVFLAGSFITGIMNFFFYALAAFPFVSLVLAFFNYRNVTFVQKFSTEHPVKGETIEYQLTIYNESPVPVPEVHVGFSSVNPLMEQVLQDFTLPLKKNSKITRTCSIRCAFRGIYQVGLRSMDITDISKFLRMELDVWNQTFYVYPRILELSSLNAPLSRMSQRGDTLVPGGIPDYTLYNSLRTWRDGDSLKHMYWKKYAATGIPFIKQYDSPGDMGIAVYFDLRRDEPAEFDILEREDVTVEIVTALVKFFLDHNVHTSVFAPGRNNIRFEGTCPADFNEFYKSTIGFDFQETISPAELFLSNSDLRERADTVIFVTHRVDSQILDIMEEARALKRNIILIVNMQGRPAPHQHYVEELLDSFRNRGCSILTVSSGQTIVTDLEKREHEIASRV